MSELGMQNVRIIIMTSPEREPPKTLSAKRSAALRSPTGITPLGIYPVFIAIKRGCHPLFIAINTTVGLHDVYLTQKCCLFS